jgi:uncharacterized beta-barrel protein YwiB (DUF1934 family)
MINFKAGAVMMKQSGKEIMIQLNTKIDDQGDIENNYLKQAGQFFNRKEIDVLIYEEELEEGAKIKNLVTIQAGKVNIKRSGFITMNQQFIVDQITETHYEHPHGNFHMETFTNAITYESMKKSDQGKLTIDYTVKLNGMDERKHLLELTYQKEDAE